MPARDDPLLLTVEQAAKLCQISRGLAYDLISRGELPHIRLGRVLRVPRHGLEQWIAHQASVGLPSVPPETVSLTPQWTAQRH